MRGLEAVVAKKSVILVRTGGFGDTNPNRENSHRRCASQGALPPSPTTNAVNAYVSSINDEKVICPPPPI